MKFTQIIFIANAIFIGSLLPINSVNALIFSLNSSSGGVFSYDVTLEAGESLVADDDFISLTNLGGVTTTNVSLDSPYATDGFSSTEADFLVTTNIPSLASPQTFFNAIYLTSNNPTGNINFEGTYDSFIGEFDGTITGPVAVPFKPTTDIVFFIFLGLIGLNYYRKKPG